MAYTFWEDKNNIILSDNVDFDGEVFLMNFTVKTKDAAAGIHFLYI